jgi:hypothetical protein
VAEPFPNLPDRAHLELGEVELVIDALELMVMVGHGDTHRAKGSSLMRVQLLSTDAVRVAEVAEVAERLGVTTTREYLERQDSTST